MFYNQQVQGLILYYVAVKSTVKHFSQPHMVLVTNTNS